MLRAIVMLGAWATLATLCFVGYLDSAGKSLIIFTFVFALAA